MTDTVIEHGHTPPTDTFVTAEEAARLADVSARTVRRWINAGEIQAEDGAKGRLVSVSDVRLRAARGHVRPRPSLNDMLSSTTRRTDTDTGKAAVMTAVSDRLAPQLTEISEQIERLVREAMTEKARADQSEAKVVQLEADLERVSAELLAAQIAGDAQSTVPEFQAPMSHPEATGRDRHSDTPHSAQGATARSWWRRLMGLS
jgi:excisionase family DNA binding protein